MILLFSVLENLSYSFSSNIFTFALFLHFKLIHEFNFFSPTSLILYSMSLLAKEIPAMVFSQQT